MYSSRMSEDKKKLAKWMRKHPTRAEYIIWQSVKSHKTGVKVRRQEPMLGYIADFCIYLNRNRDIFVIEIDGESHKDMAEYDQNRDDAMQNYGITVKRFTNAQVFKDNEIVSRYIEENILPLREPKTRNAKRQKRAEMSILPIQSQSQTQPNEKLVVV